MDKHWNEECAVVGAFNCDEAAFMAYYALFAMQHRGQEASRIAISNGKNITTQKGQGLVTKVFSKSILEKLKGMNAVGHNRYATAGRF